MIGSLWFLAGIATSEVLHWLFVRKDIKRIKEAQLRVDAMLKRVEQNRWGVFDDSFLGNKHEHTCGRK